MSPTYFPQRRPSSPFSYSTGGVQDDGSFSAPSYSGSTRPISPTVSYHGPAGGPQSDGGLSVGNVPYLPTGYKAPSPQYIDQANRAGEAADERVQRRTNFYRSVQTNNQNAQTSAGTFAAGKSMGQSDGDARRAAYLATHSSGNAYVPQSYGQVGQQGPTIVIPPYGGRTAGGGQPYAVPGNADVMMPYNGTGVKERPLNPRDRSSIAQTYNNMGATTQPSDAEAKADKDIADARAAAQPGQPAQSSAPPAPMNAQKGPEEPYGDKTKIGLTEEHARAMWDVIRHANPNAPLDSLSKTFQRTLGQYGIKGQAAQNLMQQWTADGSAVAPTPQAQTQVVPGGGARTPVSMLGPSNGLDPSQNYGQRGNGTPGPTVNAPATITTQPGLPQNQQDYTPITAESGSPQTNQPAMTGNPPQPTRITRAAAGMYLQQAGGDPAKAKAMIQQHGFDLSAGYAD